MMTNYGYLVKVIRNTPLFLFVRGLNGNIPYITVPAFVRQLPGTIVCSIVIWSQLQETMDWINEVAWVTVGLLSL